MRIGRRGLAVIAGGTSLLSLALCCGAASCSGALTLTDTADAAEARSAPPPETTRAREPEPLSSLPDASVARDGEPPATEPHDAAAATGESCVDRGDAGAPTLLYNCHADEVCYARVWCPSSLGGSPPFLDCYGGGVGDERCHKRCDSAKPCPAGSRCTKNVHLSEGQDFGYYADVCE